MNYSPPAEEIRKIAERLLKVNHDSLAFSQPAVDTFYFAVDAKRLASAYLKLTEKQPTPAEYRPEVLWE